MSLGPSGVASTASPTFWQRSFHTMLVASQKARVHADGVVPSRRPVEDDGADVAAEAVAEREQVEERLEEAGDDDRPGAPVAHHAPLRELDGPAPPQPPPPAAQPA